MGVLETIGCAVAAGAILAAGGFLISWLCKRAAKPKQLDESEQPDQTTPPPMDEETKLRWKLSALWEDEPSEDEPSEDVQEKAVEIVKLANDESANGRVVYTTHQIGFTVKIGQFTHKGKSGYEQQIWREGIALLVDGGYLDERSEHLFVLTSKGYIKALIAG